MVQILNLPKNTSDATLGWNITKGCEKHPAVVVIGHSQDREHRQVRVFAQEEVAKRITSLDDFFGVCHLKEGRALLCTINCGAEEAQELAETLKESIEELLSE